MRKAIKWILISLGLILVLLTAAPMIILHQMLDHHISYSSLYSAEDYGISAQEKFVRSSDGLQIAIYEVKAVDPKAVILTLSGIEKPSGTAFMGHAAMFQSQGYSTIMIEMRSHGRSDGSQICLGYKEPLDVGAALQYISEQPDYAGLPVVLMGLSMGGATAINSMALYPEIDALISLSAFSSCQDCFGEILEQAIPRFAAKILNPFLRVALFLRHGSDINFKPLNSIAQLNGRPALLMHTTKDSNVSFSNFLRLQAAAPQSVQSHAFEGDEHFITPEFLNPERDERYSNLVLSFIESCIQ